MNTHRTGFVGRAPELALAAECTAAAAGAEPRVVLCHGEAGIGKTRLAEEMVARAAGHGLLGIWGIADDTAGAPPYWPWRQILRTLARHIDVHSIAAEHRTATELGRIAPDVFASLAQPDAAGASSEARFRQFDAFARLVRQACTERPLAIILDDAHWADEASLLLLGHLITVLTDERLVLWVNSREPDPQQQGQFSTRWTRSSHARSIHLSGLSELAIREQLEVLIGDEVASAVVSEAQQLTRGNPFFVTEVAQILIDRRAGNHGARVTRHAVDAVRERLSRLSLRTVESMRVAAVLGQEFDVSVVAVMLGASPGECLPWLEEASRAGLTESTDAPGRQRFVHALVRDAIEVDLDSTERARLHRSAADTIQDRQGAVLAKHVFEIARHWTEAAVAGEAATAAGWLERAAEIAMRQLAYEDAEHLYGEALRIGGADLEEEGRCRLLLARARAAGAHGALGARFDACVEAADIARGLRRVDLLADAVLSIEPFGRAGFDLATRRLCQEVLVALGPEPTPLRARIAARFAETYIYLPDADAARIASLEAVSVAEQCGDAQALASALRAREVVTAGPDGFQERDRLTARLVALGRDTRRGDVELRGRLGRINVAFERGDLVRAAAEIEAAAQCANELGGLVAAFWVTQARAVLAQAQGRLAECRFLADEAFRLPLPADFHDRYLMRGAVLAVAGRHAGHDEASLRANGCADDSNTPDADLLAMPGLIADISKANVLATAHRLTEAAGLYQRLGPPSTWRSPPHVELLAHALGLEIAMALGEDADVAILRGRLEAYRGHHVACGLIPASYLGPVELWLGRAACHLRWLDAAIADLETAERLCKWNGAASFQVESQYELAAALTSRSRPDDRTAALSLVSSAAARAARLGMAPFAARIRDLAARVEQGQGSVLTPREREIAELVARGRTNRQIADSLVLSERTAQNHVQHILRKLALSNRSQVAVWVERSRADSSKPGFEQVP